MNSVDRPKYPRTPHLPDSPGATSDDKWITQEGLNHLGSGVELVTTEKMDGGNITLAPHYFHARSTSDTTPAWERRAKSEWARIRNDIPTGWRLSCESMYAQRSVSYTDLEGIILLIGVWDHTNSLISWSETQQWAGLLDVPTVPVIYQGDSLDQARQAWLASGRNPSVSEGFVIRTADRIAYEQFGSNVAKWVRPNHVTTSADWRHRDDFPLNSLRTA